MRINGYEYISLTNLARTQNDESPADVVKNWIRNRMTIEFLGLWEKINNPNFNHIEFTVFRNKAGFSGCFKYGFIWNDCKKMVRTKS